jgi:hypothetical protein
MLALAEDAKGLVTAGVYAHRGELFVGVTGAGLVAEVRSQGTCGHSRTSN